MSPAAMNTGSLFSRLVMLSTENWLMLSQLLVWVSGSWRKRRDSQSDEAFGPMEVKLLSVFTFSFIVKDHSPVYCSSRLSSGFMQSCIISG